MNAETDMGMMDLVAVMKRSPHATDRHEAEVAIGEYLHAVECGDYFESLDQVLEELGLTEAEARRLIREATR